MTDQQDAVERLLDKLPHRTKCDGGYEHVWGQGIAKEGDRFEVALEDGDYCIECDVSAYHLDLFDQAHEILEAQRSRLETCQQAVELLQLELELIDRLFSEDGVHGGWPDATADEPSDWERWVLRLHGLEAGDYLEGIDALRHIKHGLWFAALESND